MSDALHITSGDCAGDSLREAGLAGEVLVWRDILYDGPRSPGWPDWKTLEARAAFLAEETGGGLDGKTVRETLLRQYRALEAAAPGRHVVLWFDACLFDQAMLAHILACLHHLDAGGAELLCVDSFPGIEPFHGLGQLRPGQLASLYGDRRPVTDEQYAFAGRVDEAFATRDLLLLTGLSRMEEAPLPWVPAAAARWLQERPDPVTGLGRLETLALEAIRGGVRTPGEVFEAVAAADTPPQYWGDTTLWAKVNALAEREPPLVEIEGPGERLPQWESDVPLEEFSIRALTD